VNLETAAQLRARIDLTRPSAEDVARVHAAIGARGVEVMRINATAQAAGRGLLASEERDRVRHAEEMAELAALAEELEPRVPMNPEDRKIRFGRPGARRVDLGARQTLARGESMGDWLRARGRVRPEHEGLSFDRYVRGLATGRWENADRELELFQLAQSEGTSTAGGHLVPAPLSGRVIDIARAASVAMRAGAVTVPMTSQTLKIARVTDEGVPTWTAENSAASEDAMAFDAVTLTAKKLDRLCKVSIELFEDADPGIDDVIANAFGKQIALELDRAALRGSGSSNQPTGVLNTSGITSTAHGTNGTAISTLKYDFLVDSVGAVRAEDFAPNAQIMAPRTETSLAKLADSTGQYVRPPATLDDIPRLTSSQIPIDLTVGTGTTCSEVYTGQWDQLLIGIRTQFRLLFLGERFIDSGQYGFYAYLRADIQLAHPKAFVVDTGVLA
jgi:HK97 family phage major capsid protein